MWNTTEDDFHPKSQPHCHCDAHVLVCVYLYFAVLSILSFSTCVHSISSHLQLLWASLFTPLLAAGYQSRGFRQILCFGLVKCHDGILDATYCCPLHSNSDSVKLIWHGSSEEYSSKHQLSTYIHVLAVRVTVLVSPSLKYLLLSQRSLFVSRGKQKSAMGHYNLLTYLSNTNITWVHLLFQPKAQCVPELIKVVFVPKPHQTPVRSSPPITATLQWPSCYSLNVLSNTSTYCEIQWSHQARVFPPVQNFSNGVNGVSSNTLLIFLASCTDKYANKLLQLQSWMYRQNRAGGYSATICLECEQLASFYTASVK